MMEPVSARLSEKMKLSGRLNERGRLIGSIGIGRMLPNNYVLTTYEIENGYRLVITRLDGSESTLDLFGMTQDEVDAIVSSEAQRALNEQRRNSMFERQSSEMGVFQDEMYGRISRVEDSASKALRYAQSAVASVNDMTGLVSFGVDSDGHFLIHVDNNTTGLLEFSVDSSGRFCVSYDTEVM